MPSRLLSAEAEPWVFSVRHVAFDRRRDCSGIRADLCCAGPEPALIQETRRRNVPNRPIERNGMSVRPFPGQYRGNCAQQQRKVKP